MSFYLEGIKIHAKLFSIKHGLEVLHTAVNTVQIVHQLHPDERDTHCMLPCVYLLMSKTQFDLHRLLCC